jgi:O-antigen ligase
MLVVATILAVAWGTFAFGAVYPWAYVPLAVACAIIGATGLAAGRRPMHARWLFVGLVAIFAIGLIQLIPLPPSLLATLSPGTDRFLRAYDLTYAAGARSGSGGETFVGAVRHGISLVPPATVRALGLLAALTLFLAGLLRMLSSAMALRIGKGLVWLGAILALVGIVQKALLGDQAFDGMKIYGFWAPRYVLTTPFGPYVNKNHFAGWMLMVIPVAFGLVMGALETNADALGRGFRNRLLWLSGPDGGRVLMLIFAALLMSLSLVMTQSRSGLGCFVVIALITGLFSGRRLGSRRSGILLAAGLVSFVVVVLAWAGSDTALARLATEPDSVQLRLRIWRVALAIARDFPVFGTGLDTFGTATILYQPAGESLHYQEAHNEYVQLLAEGGWLLFVVVMATLVALARSIVDGFRVQEERVDVYWLRVGATIGLIAIALQSLVEFSLQMPGNAALFTVLLALALRTPDPPRASEPASRSVVTDFSPRLG